MQTIPYDITTVAVREQRAMIAGKDEAESEETLCVSMNSITTMEIIWQHLKGTENKAAMWPGYHSWIYSWIPSQHTAEVRAHPC